MHPDGASAQQGMKRVEASEALSSAGDLEQRVRSRGTLTDWREAPYGLGDRS